MERSVAAKLGGAFVVGGLIAVVAQRIMTVVILVLVMSTMFCMGIVCGNILVKRAKNSQA